MIARSRIFRVVRSFRKHQLIIFNYHRIRDPHKTTLFDEGVFGPDAVRFEEEMNWIKNETRVLSEQDLIDIVYGGKVIKETCSMVTFDDGYRDNFDLAFPILQKLKIPAIFFIPTWHINERQLGWWDIIAYLVKKTTLTTFIFEGRSYDARDKTALIRRLLNEVKSANLSEFEEHQRKLAEALKVPLPAIEVQTKELMTWEQIRAMEDGGMTIGSHTHQHVILSKQDTEGLRYQFRTSTEILKKELRKPLRSVAYPVGGYEHFNLETKQIAQEFDYQLGFSYLTGVNNLNGIDPFDVKRVDIQPQWVNLDYPLAFPERAFLSATVAAQESGKSTAIGHWPISFLNGVSAIIALCLPMLMSRLLSADEIGSYKIFFLYLVTVPSIALTGGIENGLYFWGGQGESGREEVRSAWTLTLFNSLVFFLVVASLSPWLAGWMGWTSSQMGAFVFASATVALSTFYEALLIARGKIWSGAIFAAAFDLFKTGLILAFILIYKTAESALWAYTIVCAIKIAMSLILGRKSGWIPLLPTFKSAKSVMKYALPVSFSGVFDLLMNYSDRFLLSVIINPAQFAVYTFGCLALPPLQILERSVNKVLIPRLTTAIQENDKLHAAHLYREAMEQIMMIYIPAVVGLYIFAEPIITILFTQKYIQAAIFLKVYCLWYLLAGIPYDVAARASGNGQWILRTNMLVGTISLLSCVLFTWLWGAMGALASLIFVLVLQRSLGLRQMIRHLSWDLSEMLPTRSLLLFTITSLALGAGSLFATPHFESDTKAFFVCAPIFAIVYFAVLIIAKPNLFSSFPVLNKWIRKPRTYL
jgi:O-antigen/teichoic acid export membrane protein/peptidoglycan/xylan/chitin deacetylase (PgdA/CDA1 family)